ncbi:hypothetical protein PMAYCL1PPCAC_32244, partial [Pristionchus mayeri]
MVEVLVSGGSVGGGVGGEVGGGDAGNFVGKAGQGISNRLDYSLDCLRQSALPGTVGLDAGPASISERFILRFTHSRRGLLLLFAVLACSPAEGRRSNPHALLNSLDVVCDHGNGDDEKDSNEE